ncbi:MAG: hypothetical protein AAFO07_13375, partial [Bacteroidota bacterium]
MRTAAFWRDRLIFFVAIWSFTMAIVSFILIVSTNGINEAYWNSILNIGIRAIFNFGSYILIFSIAINWLNRYFPYNKKLLFYRLSISGVLILFVAYNFATINKNFPFPQVFQDVEDDFLF